MIVLLASLLEHIEAFVWSEFQKDIEWSENLYRHCDKFFVLLRERFK